MPAMPTSKATKATLMINLFMTLFPLSRLDATTTCWARSLAKYLNTVSRTPDTA